jgi:chorismate lyase / 3-hydroxybenzoate synthase
MKPVQSFPSTRTQGEGAEASPSAALKLDYFPSDHIAAQPASWWRDVLGVVGFPRPPAVNGVPAPVTASMTPLLGSSGNLCEVWRVASPGVRLASGATREGGVRYRFCDDLLFGSITLEERSMRHGGEAAHPAEPGVDAGRLSEHGGEAGHPASEALQRATEIAYREIFEALNETDHRHLIRIWNYLPEINREADGDERYRHFNSARQLAFRNSGRAIIGSVPAASALGSPAGSPISIYFLASRRRPKMIENPRQTSAYHYPPKYGRHSPIFSRACVLSESTGTNLFISGTSSIVGHETIHQGDVAAQTRETLANIGALLEEANRVLGSRRYSLDGLKLKVYVRQPPDLKIIAAALEARVRSSTPIIYLQADVCREDLMVEIEATGES